MKGCSKMSRDTRIPNNTSVPIFKGRSVTVKNGDLEEALSMFTRIVEKEKILDEYGKHRSFTPKRKR